MLLLLLLLVHRDIMKRLVSLRHLECLARCNLPGSHGIKGREACHYNGLLHLHYRQLSHSSQMAELCCLSTYFMHRILTLQTRNSIIGSQKQCLSCTQRRK